MAGSRTCQRAALGIWWDGIPRWKATSRKSGAPATAGGGSVRCDFGIILTPDNVVACVAKINGIIKRDDMRMGFIGKPIHGDYDNWIGKILERNDSKNPIAYFDERAILPPSKVTEDTEKLNR